MAKGCYYKKYMFLAPEMIRALQPGANGNMICCMDKAERMILRILCEEAGSP